MIGWLQQILNRIGTPTDTDISIDIFNLDGKIGEPADADIATDIANVQTVVDALPTTGAVPSTASATATGVIVQDGATGAPNIITFANTNGVNTFTAFAAFDASASADSYVSHLSVYGSYASSFNYCVEIATGGAGSEVVKARFSGFSSVRYNGVAAVYVVKDKFVLPVPIKVASGVRISAHVSTTVDNISISAALSMYQSLE